MKWARVKPSRSEQLGRDPDLLRDDAECFKDYSSEKHIKKAFEHLSHQWAHHKFRFSFKSEKEYIKFQKRYQLFCGGYLYYYDEKVRNGSTDHAIHFKWSEFCEDSNDYLVAIYLTPAPAKKRADDKPYRKQESEQDYEQITSYKKAGNGVAETQVLAQVKSQTTTAVANSTDDAGDEAIDPPPPPPPPPPSRQGDL
jgi:hypothetical protein